MRTKQIIEASLPASKEYIFGVIQNFNRTHKDNFPYPLWSVTLSECGNESTTEYVVNANIYEERKVIPGGMVGLISMTSAGHNVTVLRMACYQSDYEWAIGYFQLLKDHLLVVYQSSISKS